MPATEGLADYLLKNFRTQPLAMIKGHRITMKLYSTKEKAITYALSITTPFVFLSNGLKYYFGGSVEFEVLR